MFLCVLHKVLYRKNSKMRFLWNGANGKIHPELELRKKYCFLKKILISFDFNVQPHCLPNFVLSSFNLTNLTLDRETDRYCLG